MSSEPIVEVNRICKKFSRNFRKSLKSGFTEAYKETLGLNWRSKDTEAGEFLALKNIDFKIHRGESVGLIGRNGSGKTTLLKILSGILKPDRGHVRISGKVVPLFARGAGFNPNLSGMENITFNLSLLGVPRHLQYEKRKLIVDFSELDQEALNAPVKTYSSGMGARLGFACATFADPDILIIDETLAVGDIRFRLKCYKKLHELKTNGTTFILVSHAPNAIMNNCDLALYLQKGKQIFWGDSKEAVKLYEENEEEIHQHKTETQQKLVNSVSQTLQVEEVAFEGPQNKDHLVTGAPGKIVIHVTSQIDADNLIFGIVIKDLNLGLDRILHMNSEDNKNFLSLRKGHNTLSVDFSTCHLKPSLYTLKFFIATEQAGNIVSMGENYRFEVKSDLLMPLSLFFQPAVFSARPE